MAISPLLWVLSAFVLTAAAKTSKETDFDKDDLPSAEHLLRKIVPTGSLPTLPDGFPELSDLRTDRFDYHIDKGRVTVVADLEDPVSLFGHGMQIHGVRMTFHYNKNSSKGRWKFNAEGKWKHGNMTARVRIEESRMGNHHTMVAAADSVNVFDVASALSENEDLKHTGMNIETLQNLNLKDVEMYSVFKGNKDYVFMLAGRPMLTGIKATDSKVFIRRTPKKKGVFSVLLEFKHELPSRVLLKLVSDGLFDIPFINHLIAKTRMFRTTKTDFGFVASTGDVDKLPLKSFGDGILADELDSRIYKGLTLLLPFRLGGEDVKPIKVAIVVSPPLVKFVTAKHEKVSVAQTLNALSPSSEVRVLPSGFPSLSKVNIHHFSYNIDQETFSVYARVTDPIPAVPGLMNFTNSRVVFRHRVGDVIDTWNFEGHGEAELGGSKSQIIITTDDDTGVVFIKGKAQKLSVAQLAKQYGVSFIQDNESKSIVEASKMVDFEFINPDIKSATSHAHKSKYIHISGLGKFPGIDKTTEAEAVVYEDNGKMKTAVGFIFPAVSTQSVIKALTGFDTSQLKILKNTFNTSLILCPDDDQSLFENPTLSGLAFEKGLSLVTLFRVPEECEEDKQCEAAQSMLESDQLYRIQGVVKRRGFSLAGLVNRDYILGNGLVLKDNLLHISIAEQSFFDVHTNLKLPKEEVTFTGTMEFGNGTVDLRMTSNDTMYRSTHSGYLSLDELRLETPIMDTLPLQTLNVKAKLSLGKPEAKKELRASASMSYFPMSPEKSSFEAMFENVTMENIVKAMDIKNASLPGALAAAPFTNGVRVFFDPMKHNSHFYLKGRLELFDRHFDCTIQFKDPSHIEVTSKNTRSPFVLANGFIIVQNSKKYSMGGPMLQARISPNKVELQLVGFVRAFGIGAETKLDISDSGTGFPVFGNLYNLTKTGLLFSSQDMLGSSEFTKFKVYGCMPDLHEDVIAAVDNILRAAADEADSFITQASENLREAKTYYRQATKNEEHFRTNVKQQADILEKRERDMWIAEERYNNSCQLDHCKKSCIGCPDWNRCCSRDVFGSCVECPSWNKCCYKSGDPVCVAKNHGCEHIRKVATGNLQDAKDIYELQKARMEESTQRLYDAEFSKGRTKAVLDAAGKALSLIDRDSTIGIEASKAVKRFGVRNLVKINSICFHVPVESLASSCIDININATILNKTENMSLPFHGCLNKELVPRMARLLANNVFPDVSGGKAKRSVLSEENVRMNSEEQEGDDEELLRKARGAERGDGEVHPADKIEPFWEIIHQHDPLVEMSKAPPTSHSTLSNFKRKWKIPASKSGRCKIYHQLLDICRDMMKTVKKMHSTYTYEKFLLNKQEDRMKRKLKRVTSDLEKSAKQVSGTEFQMEKIERSLKFVSDGVKKWSRKCDSALKHQNEISVQAWVKGMDARIKSLGGEGVERFLANLFRAFDGLFDSSNMPAKDASKAINVMQRVRQIKGAFEQIFLKKITLAKANYFADRVLFDTTEIKGVAVYCKP